MKIGNLEFKDYAAQKPLTISPTGQFLTASEVVSTPSLSLGSLHALSPEHQLELALKRYEFEPDFKLGIIGVGVLTKDEIVEHLKAQTEFGQMALGAEMGYCNELTATLAAQAVAPWPELPSTALPEAPEIKRRKRCFWLRLPTRALFCEDTTDPVTTPIANYRIRNVHPAFQNRGFTVVALTGIDDIRSNFVPHAKNGLTCYLGGVGHGLYTEYTGHWGNRILKVGQYDSAEVKGRSIHFLSCQTATRLGPDTVSQGANSYAGYTENFIFVWDDAVTPVNEFELFVKSDSMYDLMMANGATAQQAYSATVQAFNAAIGQVPNQVAATYLTWDRNHLRLHGDPQAKIFPYRYLKICFPFPLLEAQDALLKVGELQD